MSDFLLELRSEEIPARMQKGARAELEKLFRREMDAAGVALGELTVWSTPRRLALIARDLPTETEAVSEEAKGPPEGAPDQAVDGFCRKNGVTRDQLEVRDVKGRPTYFAVINTPGRAVADVLATAIPAIIRDFSWPKSQRWGAASISTESLRWVRPLSGIVALLGTDGVECEVHGITAGALTRGHRFHHDGDITIGSAADYVDKLRAAHVIVDHEERQNIIRDGAKKAAADGGLDLVEDEGLVVENAGLTEWPVPLLGRFEDDFLEVPPETIQLTARVNQKYFVCEKDGKLANAFICTANIEADDPAVVVEGNRKVLAARLSDAKFFWDVDRKKTLEEHAKGLERITFHEKLGTVADKVERVAKLARWLVEEGIVVDTPLPTGEGPRVGGATPQALSTHPQPLPSREGASLADLAEQAARLCKADLVTEMVGEFPELQGLMGGYYARAEGLDDAVADAIRDHYKPVGQGDDVPTAPVTVAVSLADKLDTLLLLYTFETPTGSKDPFAVRRAMLGVLRLMQANQVRVSFAELLEQVSEPAQNWEVSRANAVNQMLSVIPIFAVDRLKVQQREAGVRHDLIDAVFSLGGEDDLVRLLARVHALQAFMETEDGTNLLAGYKRASNILKKENHLVIPAKAGAQSGADNQTTLDRPSATGVPRLRGNDGGAGGLSYSPENAEKALIDALDAAEPKATAAIEAEDFGAAMAALASLRAPIDAFFDEVTVNDDDQDKRAARLDLLLRFRNAVHQVADFSRIEG
ncbi:glycine--tRNA ligase subunit beta [Pontixanthobacter aestiaquae]|uniref:Glycine--tRNA ligase beta subunit n=1 Tax=Pontixanthobacter aestiaquae TaxID=1509367 RepID=A0A844Z8I7_9SPHN|nr:glycine--tRNA ligase subunit beta [Pontixanthobacter aestiaquae]MDN3645464.1 glycine--tRNA ligase subunit beta [Pontixanthobacter aestiaquae]MXO83536.1 glycine--tRNA ligase subunit beta [Pontixanthobacter aestiaquae]